MDDRNSASRWRQVIVPHKQRSHKSLKMRLLGRRHNDTKSTTTTRASYTQDDGYLTIRPRVQGVFAPSLPPELWLHILRLAASDDDEFCPYASPYKPTSTSASFSTQQHTFLTHPPAHAHLSERLAAYNARLGWKASLTRVCRMWNAVGQEVLFECVWIGSARVGRRVAGRLGGDTEGIVEVWASSKDDSNKDKKWWKGKAKTRTKADEEKQVVRKRSFSGASSAGSAHNPGRYIRQLRIETPAMDKCSPHDLLLILQHCPLLEVFEDCRSVRRPQHPLVITHSDVVPFGSTTRPDFVEDDHLFPHTPSSTSAHLTTDALSHAVLSRPLKRLTWTNYGHDGGEDFERGVRLYEQIVGPLLGRVGEVLEVLEVMSCAEGMGMGMGGERSTWGVGMGDSEREMRRRKSTRTRTTPVVPPPLSASRFGLNEGFGSTGLLTELRAEYTTTQHFISYDLSTPSSPTDLAPPLLLLPSLRSLKVTLDNATFFVLSSWCMPLLRNLSVISADFGYAGEGFRRFFEVHGAKIEQLELGHSSGEIEEYWITDPPVAPNATNANANAAGAGPRFQIPLDAWCPNLLEFICSADAEWNWQSPDWIAPHVLLPAHAGLEFIGVRDMQRRLVGDADEAGRRRRVHHWGGQAHVHGEEDVYFMLLEQFGSLLRKEAFPSLLYVRDMSWESDVMRRTGRMSVNGVGGVPPSPSSSSAIISTSTSTFNPCRLLTAKFSPSHANLASAAVAQYNQVLADEEALARIHGARVLRFWASVLERCKARGVWLEDWRGVNVTLGNLRRAGAGV